MNVTAGIEAIGYTNDGFVFFKLVTTYEDKPIMSIVQFDIDNVRNFCKCLMDASIKAEELKPPKEVDN